MCPFISKPKLKIYIYVLVKFLTANPVSMKWIVDKQDYLGILCLNLIGWQF